MIAGWSAADLFMWKLSAGYDIDDVTYLYHYENEMALVQASATNWDYNHWQTLALANAWSNAGIFGLLSFTQLLSMMGIAVGLNMSLWKWGTMLAGVVGSLVDLGYSVAMYFAYQTCTDGTSVSGTTVSYTTDGANGCALIEKISADLVSLQASQLGVSWGLYNSYNDWLSGQYRKAKPDKQSDIDKAIAEGALFAI